MSGRAAGINARSPAIAGVWTAFVWALFAALAAALCAIVAWRYAIFRNDVDLGIFTQVIAGVGRGFSSTAEGGTNHLLVHWSPLIAVAWPFLRAFGPVGLQYFQAIAVAATVFPIWGLARARFAPPAAFSVVAVAAIYPILWANGVGDFHEMAFVPLCSAVLVYALDRRRWSAAIGAALLLACVKEDQFFVLAANGALFAATARRDREERRIGWILCGVAVAMAVFYFGVVRGLLAPHAPYQALKFFDWSGAPISASSLLLPRLQYALMILGPLAFLPCASRYGLFLVPGFIEIFATNQPVTLAAGAHYSALLTGYALAGFTDGARVFDELGGVFSKLAVPVCAILCASVQIFASPMEYWYYLYRWPDAHDARLSRVLARLPSRAAVGAEDEIFAHLGLDPNATVTFHGQPWFVYDATHYSRQWRDVDEPEVRRALALRQYDVKTDRDGIVVLERSK